MITFNRNITPFNQEFMHEFVILFDRHRVITTKEKKFSFKIYSPLMGYDIRILRLMSGK